MKMKFKKQIFIILTFALSIVFSACGKNQKNPLNSSDSENGQKPHVRIGLCQQNMLDGTPKAIRNAFPDVDFEFIITNNSADYNVYLYKHKDLPDILTIRRFSLNDALALKDTLVDLRNSDIAAGFYQNYLHSFTYEDGTLNWLPAVAEVWGIVANKTLFDAHKIALPTNYKSFLEACAAFEKKGIKGFETDWKYDYSSLEILEGLNIEILQSLEGKRWRAAYESGKTLEAEKKVWLDAFEKMYEFLQVTDNIDKPGTDKKESLVTRGYSDEKAKIESGRVAMIRASGADIVRYTNDTGNEFVMLPYFSHNEEWILTYPFFSAAINKNSKIDSNLLLKIYAFMLSQDCQNTLDTGEYVLSYTTDVKVTANSLLSNLNDFIESNRVFVRLANNSLFAASKEAVQGMISGNFDAESAYEAFNSRLKKEAKGIEYDYYVDKSYSYKFQKDKGCESVSAILNSCREIWKTDFAVTYAPSYSNSIYEGKAASSQIPYYISSNPPSDYYLELTGREIKSLVGAMLHYSPDKNGMFGGKSPVTNDMLPVCSGFEIKVKKVDAGYTLEKLTVGGNDIDEDEMYTICYNVPSYYGSYIAAKAGITLPKDCQKILPEIRETLEQYLITEGRQFASPSKYIELE